MGHGVVRMVSGCFQDTQASCYVSYDVNLEVFSRWCCLLTSKGSSSNSEGSSSSSSSTTVHRPSEYVHVDSGIRAKFTPGKQTVGSDSYGRRSIARLCTLERELNNATAGRLGPMRVGVATHCLRTSLTLLVASRPRTIRSSNVKMVQVIRPSPRPRLLVPRVRVVCFRRSTFFVCSCLTPPRRHPPPLPNKIWLGKNVR